jgi:hypothetical protein
MVMGTNANANPGFHYQGTQNLGVFLVQCRVRATGYRLKELPLADVHAWVDVHLALAADTWSGALEQCFRKFQYTYVGQWQGGKKHGHGVLTHGEFQDTYVGEFQDGEQHGHAGFSRTASFSTHTSASLSTAGSTGTGLPRTKTVPHPPTSGWTALQRR